MAERYARLFALPGNLYAEASPVVIAAGALLKDNQTGKVLAQLKLRNIQHKTIKAATVRIVTKDVAGVVLGEPLEHQYLDIRVTRDQDFAQKVPVILPENKTREIEVAVSQVIFSDNSVWDASTDTWEPLNTPVPLSETLKDAELVKQYKIKYGDSCNYIPLEQKDLWYCSCGALNRYSEVSCHECHQPLSTLLSLDLDALRAECAERTEKERLAAEAALAEATALRKKKVKIATAITAVVLVICAVAAIIITKPARVMRNAREIAESGDYLAAVALLDELNKPEKTNADREVYLDAMEAEIQAAIKAKDYAKAMDLVEKYTVLDSSKMNIASIQRRCTHPDWISARVESTCTEDGYDGKSCTVCGYIEGTVFRAPGHDYLSEIHSEATCTKSGSATLTCSVCGESHDEELEMLPHDYETTITKKATCTEEGESLRACLMCGDRTTSVIPAIGHNNAEKTLQAATCTSAGSKQMVCSNCGKTGDVVAVPSSGHTWVNATCSAPKTCSTCGITEGAQTAHDWYLPANKHACCRFCGELYPDNITVTPSMSLPLILDLPETRNGKQARINRIYIEHVSVRNIDRAVPLAHVSIAFEGYIPTDTDYTGYVQINYDAHLYDSSGKLVKTGHLYIDSNHIGNFVTTTTYFDVPVNENYVLKISEIGEGELVWPDSMFPGGNFVPRT